MKIYCDIIKENVIESINEVVAVEIDTFALPEDIKFKSNKTYTLWLDIDSSIEFTVKHYFISEERIILEGYGTYNLVDMSDL